MTRDLRPATFEEVRVDWLQHEQRTRPALFSDYSNNDRALMLMKPPIESSRMDRWLQVRFGPRSPLMCSLELAADEWRLVTLEASDAGRVHPIHMQSWEELAGPGGSIEDVGAAYNRWAAGGGPRFGEEARRILEELQRWSLPAASESMVSGRFVLVRGISGRVTVLDGNHRAAAQCALGGFPSEAVPSQEAWFADLRRRHAFAP